MRTEPERTARDIAAELEVAHSTVVRDLAFLRREWTARRVVDVEAYAGRELARLEHVVAEAWRAWERSLEEVRTERVVERRTERRLLVEVVGVDGREGDAGAAATLRVPVLEIRTTVVRTVRPGLGNPAYLKAHLDATEAISRLLNLKGVARPRLGAARVTDPSERGQADCFDNISCVLDALERAGLLDPSMRSAAEAVALADELDA